MSGTWTVTLRIDTSNWSANREYLWTNPVPTGMGHAWLTVASPDGHRVDLGYYPTANAVHTPGALLVGDVAHQPMQDAAYTYQITPAQAARLLDAAERIHAFPGQYDVVNHNCLTVAHHLLTVAGVAMPPLPTDPGVYSHTAWVTGTPQTRDTFHGPAAYNQTLRSTPDGMAARTLYEHSSELSGTHTGDLDPLLQEATAQSSIDLGDVDAPDFVHPGLSTPDHGGSPADPGLSDPHAAEGAGPDPGLSYHDGGWSHDPGLSDAGWSHDPGRSDAGWSHDPGRSDAGWSHDPGRSDGGSSHDPGAHDPGPSDGGYTDHPHH